MCVCVCVCVYVKGFKFGQEMGIYPRLLMLSRLVQSSEHIGSFTHFLWSLFACFNGNFKNLQHESWSTIEEYTEIYKSRLSELKLQHPKSERCAVSTAYCTMFRPVQAQSYPSVFQYNLREERYPICDK